MNLVKKGAMAKKTKSNADIKEGRIRQSTSNALPDRVAVEPEPRTNKKGKEQMLITCMSFFRTDAGLWQICIDDGTPTGSALGPRLAKKDDYPDFPTETANYLDVEPLLVTWQDWINDQNEGVKRYFRG
jgi:hypothetical protein